MSFWVQFDEDKKANDINHPPLTDETVAFCEAHYGVKFPKQLLTLLREKNGGYLVDTEFKLGGKDYQVDSIFGLAAPQEWGNIKPITRIFDPKEEVEIHRQLQAKIGNPDLVLPFADFAGHCMYALDYNQMARSGEPKIVYLLIESDVCVKTIAESFDAFLKGHYLGEAISAVDLAEVAGETVLLESSIAARHNHGDIDIKFFHWVCGRKTEVVVYSKTVWDKTVTLRKSVISRRSLEPEFCEITKVVYIAEPAVYELCLHVNPRRKLASIEESTPAGRLWKNTRCELLYDSVHSRDRSQLLQLRKQLFPNYQGKPTSFTKSLNSLLKDLGIQ